MNIARARELFSAHQDGTLDAALRPGFERALATDAQVQAEYRKFQQTFGDLDSLREEVIEIPQYLSTRIATRLEENEARRPRAFLPAFGSWWRAAALGGLAVVAIGGTLVSLTARGGRQALGGAVAVGGSARVDYAFEGRVLTVSGVGLAVTSGDKTTRAVGDQPVRLENPNPIPAEFAVRADGLPTEVVIVPGASRAAEDSGTGSLADLARAVASRTGRPVRFERPDDDVRLSWNLSGADALSAANAALGAHGYSADLRDGGTIVFAK